MSSWIVDKKSIDRIITWLVAKHKVDINNADKYGQKLVNANYKAVNQRYSDHESQKPYKYIFSHEQASIYQVLKSAHCLSYQMCEGTVPKMKIYNELEKTISSMMYEIIDKLPEYEIVEWE